MATLDFNYDTKVMTVESPDIQITVQEMVNLIAAEKVTSLSMDDVQIIGGTPSDPLGSQSLGYQSIAVWEGKGSLGLPGEFTQILIKLLDWKLDFAEFVASGPLEAFVLGGSLLAVDINGVSVNPIVSTVNVVTIAQSGSGTLLEGQANKQLQFAIESNSARSKGFKATGEVYYVDPTNGDNLNDGLLPERPTVGSLRGPKATVMGVSGAYALTESAKHDVIYLVQSNPGADTVLTENFVLTKDDVHVRGQGKGLVIRPSDPNTPTIQITGAHVGLRDFRVQGLTGSAVACVECVGPEPNLDRIIIENGDAHGLLVRATADHFEIVDCFVHDCVATGIRLESTPDGLIKGGRVHTNDLGIHFSGAVDGHCIVEEVFVYDNVTKGVRIDAGYEETFITETVRFVENGTGQPGGSTPEHDIEDLEVTTTQIVVRPRDVLVATDRNSSLVEQTRESHVWQGSVCYVDPVNGNDNHAGTKQNPFMTFAAAHASAVDNAFDLILLVGGASAIVELDEPVVITKANLLVRGPGNGFRWKSTVAGTVIDVRAPGVELSGFRVQGHTVGSGHGISATSADELLIHNVFVERAQGNGIDILNSKNGQITNCTFNGRAGGPSRNIVGHGIAVRGTSLLTSYQRIEDNRFLGVGGDGISCQDTVNDTIILRNIIHDGAGWGIRVAVGNTGTIARDNQIARNTLGSWVDDSGMGDFVNNEQWHKDTAGDDHVAIDAANGTAGTAFPIGTDKVPANNLADAKIIAADRGLTNFRITGTLMIGASDDLDGLSFEGTNPLVDLIVLSAGCTTEATSFTSMILTGVVGGGIYCNRVGIVALTNIGSEVGPSLFNECILLESTIGFRSGMTTPENTQFAQCFAGVAAATGTILDFNGTAQRIALRKFGGGFTARNFTAPGNVLDVGMSHGIATVEVTCTDGVINVAGVGVLVDSSGAGCDVTSTLGALETTARLAVALAAAG